MFSSVVRQGAAVTVVFRAGSGGFRLGAGGTGPQILPSPQFIIGFIVISVSRFCLPNDEGPGPKYFFLEPPLREGRFPG